MFEACVCVQVYIHVTIIKTEEMSLLAIVPPPSASGIKTTLTNDTVSYPVVTLHVAVY